MRPDHRPGPGVHRTYFNPRTPYGVRQAPPYRTRITPTFQSTHSIRSATIQLLRDPHNFLISIHALHTECDGYVLQTPAGPSYFNPSTPYGVRLNAGTYRSMRELFQSTHSIRSATPSAVSPDLIPSRFQSTHSIRSATWVSPSRPLSTRISIHALHTECDSQGR